MSLTTTPASLTVKAGNSPMAIGITAPADTQYPQSQLRVMVTGLPTDGTVYLSDGITPVLFGELLSAAELTGLTFAGGAEAAGASAQFAYTVSDPDGTTSTGAATLSVVANADGPVTSPASLTVSANAGPTAIGIAAPTDPADPTSSLTITVLGLPSEGMILLADGVTPVSAGEFLTASQLTGLKFTPHAGVVAESSIFSYSVSDPAGNSSFGEATLSVAPTGNVLRVGAGKEFSTIAAAVAAAQNGDTIQVDAGTYVNDFASISKNVTLEGVGGMVNMVSTGPIPNGKGIFVTNGDITINNFSFSGARVSDGNGAGIRFESGNLVLNNDAFFDNENGLLSANPGSGSLTINNSEFADNGAGDGFTHNLYVGLIGTLTIDNSYFHDANVGHEIKSRALNTTIKNSRVYDGPSGTASYSIDLPNGGNAVIANNVIEQGPLSPNSIIITFGEDGGIYNSSALTVSNNTILNDLSSSSALGIKNSSTAAAQITGDRFFGLSASQIASGPNFQSGNQFLSNEPSLDTSHPWSPEVACYCRGTLILTQDGDVPVEALAIGDRLVTRDGTAERLKWIGRRSYLGWLAAGNPKVLPVCFKPGSLAGGVPRRELWVSPEHAMYLDGVLVPAELLVNGSSIIKAASVDEVEYFHLELEAHDVILAEGAWAESFVDDDSRGMFHNAAEFRALYPEAPLHPPARYCAPRVEEGFELEALRRRLAGRARRLQPDGTAATAAALEGHLDLVRHDRIAGWARDPEMPAAPVALVVLANGAEIGRVMADRYRGDLAAAGIDDGCHGFELVVPGGLAADWSHTIEVCHADAWTMLPGSPAVLHPTADGFRDKALGCFAAVSA